MPNEFTPGGTIDDWLTRREDEPNYSDVLTALFAGSKFGERDPAETLRSLLELLGDEPTEATEMSSVIDPMQRMGQFRNQEFGPRATGVPYIFTGGPLAPQTSGQQTAEKIMATGAFTNNLLSSLNAVLPAVVDAWNQRKERQRRQQAETQEPITGLPWQD